MTNLMVTMEERMKILAMVQQGKISAEQGVQLLEVLGSAGAIPPMGPPPFLAHSDSRWFRVQVTDTSTGRTRVNLRLPAGLVSAGAKMGARFAPQVEGLDSNTLIAYLDSGESGKIVDVYNEENNERVQVFVE